MSVVEVATVITRMQAGAGGVALRGALALDPARYRVTFIAGSGDRTLDRAREAGLRTMLLDTLVPEISPRDDAAALLALRRMIRQGGYDVVHTHSAKAGTLGRLAAVGVGVPVVVHTMHGFPFHEFMSRPRHAAYVAVERMLGRRTSTLLAVGSAVAAEAVRRGIVAPDRVRTIGAAIDPIQVADFGNARRAARRRMQVPPGMHVVGTVGRLDYQKAPEHFADAIAALDRPDVMAIWIGGGPLRARVEEHARRLGLADRFVCLGDRDDVPELLPGLDLFAMSSRYEGVPCALIEAMSIGLPAVATAVNAVPDVIVAGETGLLVPPERPADLALALGFLLDHPDRAARMGQAGQRRVAGQYTAESLGPVLEDAYRLPGPADRPTPRRLHLPRTA